MSKIYNVQDRMLSLLTSDPFFTDKTVPLFPKEIIPILSQRKADIANEVQNALNNIGLCVLIMLPTDQFRRDRPADLASTFVRGRCLGKPDD